MTPRRELQFHFSPENGWQLTVSDFPNSKIEQVRVEILNLGSHDLPDALREAAIWLQWHPYQPENAFKDPQKPDLPPKRPRVSPKPRKRPGKALSDLEMASQFGLNPYFEIQKQAKEALRP